MWILSGLLLLGMLGILVVLILVWQRQSRQALDPEHIAVAVLNAQQQVGHQLGRELRSEIQHSIGAARQEHTQSLNALQGMLSQQSLEAMRQQSERTEALSQLMLNQFNALTQANNRRMEEIRTELQTQLGLLQQSNAAKLDEMRQTVDEKLHHTLHSRLNESFKHVAERLEQVHKGLGEMHTLAQGVGDLKHLLTNVKTRGIFGESQLASLLELVFTPEQYGAQVVTNPGSRNPVDFAIRLPGRLEDATPVWLPIDAKFPTDDYERLLQAQQDANASEAEQAGKALETRIRTEAKSIAEKYIHPPHTTDFAILFLPSEGLYAEVLRRPNLAESLQRSYRITLAGPSTLLAMLNALQMGFRTLVLEKRSSEVWQVLGAVKTEFVKFGDVLTKVRDQTQTVLNTLDRAQTRTNVMNRTLKQVQALPEHQAANWLVAELPANTVKHKENAEDEE